MVTVTDPYLWLEDQNAPRTREWLEEQDKITRAYLDSLPGRDALRRKLESMIRIDSKSMPTVRNGRYFFSRRLASEDRASLYDRDQLLVAPADISTDPTASVFYLAFSTDGNAVAYGLRMGGDDEYEVRFLHAPDILPKQRYNGISITPDGLGVYYGTVGGEKGAGLWFHVMGTDPTTDRKIFGDGYAPLDFIGGELSPDGKWLLIAAYQGVPAKHTDIFLQAESGPILPVVKEDGQWAAEFAGDSLLLTTNHQTPNQHIYRVTLADQQWKEIVPEGELAIDGVSAVGCRIYVSYLEDVHTRIRMFDIDGTSLGDLQLPGVGTASVPYGRWEETEAFFSFTSFVEPTTSYRLADRAIWFRPNIPIDTTAMETKQVWYTSKDGTRVPMFVIHKRGLPLDGARPTWLTGYGGFNVSLTPAFSAIAAWWVEQGGVFAQPSLRGGGEFGEKWHEAGMFERKQNVFDDFIAAAEYLIANRYTSPEHLGIQGGSNGGLLMGAMMTQRPDLFAAIVCGAPLLDMLRFHKMSIGSIWTAEYGSPDNPKQLVYLWKYSPYHNVVEGTNYPAVLFVTGDVDTRVDPAHARKMTALMQSANGGPNPILLRYDTKGGHIGAANVSKYLDEWVDQAGFMAARTGLKC